MSTSSSVRKTFLPSPKQQLAQLQRVSIKLTANWQISEQSKSTVITQVHCTSAIFHPFQTICQVSSNIYHHNQNLGEKKKKKQRRYKGEKNSILKNLFLLLALYGLFTFLLSISLSSSSHKHVTQTFKM